MEQKTEKITKNNLGKIKQNGYNNNILNAKKENKRINAENSNARYRKLSIEERIKLVKSRPGESKKELARLEKLLAEQPKVEVKPKPEVKPKVKSIKKKIENPV